MRSPSEPEPSDSKEHSLLEAAEAGHFVPDERHIRTKLLEESEKNMRANMFPDLYPRRSRNMDALFELLRQCYTPRYDDFWLEARLLRLMDKHDQCRQLCQSRPMCDWSFDVLQEFVWASRGDCYPYERRTDFQMEEENNLATQLYAAAKTMHDAKCYQWQQAHDAATKPNEKEGRISWFNGIGIFVTLVATGLTWFFVTWWAALIVFGIGSNVALGVVGDSDELVKGRMARWRRENPKPQNMRLTLHHLPPPYVHISPFSA
jgi:hypothetical protein